MFWSVLCPDDQVHSDHKVARVTCSGQLTSPQGGLVGRTLIDLVPEVGDTSFLGGFQPDGRHLVEEYLRLAFNQVVPRLIPVSSLDVQSMDVATVLRRYFESFFSVDSPDDLEVKFDGINLFLVLSSVVLKGSSKETLSEEEAGNPVVDGLPVVDPALDEVDPLLVVLYPRVQRLQ